MVIGRVGGFARMLDGGDEPWMAAAGSPLARSAGPAERSSAGSTASAVAVGPSPRFWSKLASLSGLAPASATKVTPLRDSVSAARERIDLIGSATRSIVATVYCLAPDDGGVEYVHALTAAAKRGVTVVLCRDGIAKLANGNLGTRAADLERAISELTAAGGTVITFGGVVENLANLGNGLHLKTLAVDGERAIIGGRNVGRMFDTWPDFDVRFEGEIAANITLQALPTIERVLRRSGEGLLLSYERRMKLYADLAQIEAEARVQRTRARAPEPGPRYSVIVADPVALRRGFVERPNPATEALIAAIDQAQTRITFSSNYVRLIPTVAAALLRARARGVEITAVTTGLSASKLSTMSYYDAEDDYAWLREHGIRVIETRTQEHGKMFVFDDALLMFGSYNMEHQADRSLVEGVILTDDPALITAANAALEETVETRRETPEEHKAAEPSPIVAFFSRILAFLLSPFL